MDPSWNWNLKFSKSYFKNEWFVNFVIKKHVDMEFICKGISALRVQPESSPKTKDNGDQEELTTKCWTILICKDL